MIMEKNPSRQHETHVWSDWLVKDRAAHYRYCMIKFCPATQDRQAARA